MSGIVQQTSSLITRLTSAGSPSRLNMQQPQPQQDISEILQELRAGQQAQEAQMLALMQQVATQGSSLKQHMDSSSDALAAKLKAHLEEQDSKIAAVRATQARMDTRLSHVEDAVRELQQDTAQRRRTLWDVGTANDARARAEAMRTRIVRGGNPGAVQAAISQRLGADLEHSFLVRNGRTGAVVGVAFRTHPGVMAKTRVPEAAAAVDANLKVGAFQTDLQMARWRLVEKFLAWAAAEPDVKHQCVFVVIKGELHVKRAPQAPEAGPSSAAGAANTAAGGGERAYPLYLHVDVGSNGLPALQELNADDVLSVVCALLNAPSPAQPSAAQPSAAQPSAAQPSAGQPSTAQPSTAQPSAGDDAGWEQQRRRGASSSTGTARHQQSRPDITPQEHKRLARRPDLGQVGDNLLALFGRGDAMETEETPALPVSTTASTSAAAAAGMASAAPLPASMAATVQAPAVPLTVAPPGPPGPPPGRQPASSQQRVPSPPRAPNLPPPIPPPAPPQRPGATTGVGARPPVGAHHSSHSSTSVRSNPTGRGDRGATSNTARGGRGRGRGGAQPSGNDNPADTRPAGGGGSDTERGTSAGGAALPPGSASGGRSVGGGVA
jgi:hypothetical protein